MKWLWLRFQGSSPIGKVDGQHEKPETDNPGAGGKNALDGQPFGGLDTTQESIPNMSVSVGSRQKHKENKEWGEKKGSNICITGGPGSRKWGQKKENVWSNSDSEFPPKLLSESKLQIWETQKTSIRINAETKRSKQASTTPRLIIFKPWRIKDAGRGVNVERRGGNGIHSGSKIRRHPSFQKPHKQKDDRMMCLMHWEKPHPTSLLLFALWSSL